MPQQQLRITATAPRGPERLWPEAGQFADGWHPFIDWMEKEPRPGRCIRRFGVKGDDTVYREELTYISDSDQTLTYRALSGIEGVGSYVARLKLSATESGADISWQADVDAPAARLTEIIDGTRAVFQAGVDTIAQMDSAAPKPRAPRRAALPLEARLLEGTPRLGLSVAPEGLREADTICLFLHGIGGNRSNWDTQLTRLGHDFPVVAMDLRGYGDSTLGFGPSTVDDYCDDIETVMAHFGATKLVLVGLSYGSWIATSFAMRHPERLVGLVLSGGCTGMSEADPDERETFRVSRQVPLDAGQTPADFAGAVVDVISGPNASTEARKALHASMAAIPADTYRDALNCFCNPLEVFDFGRLKCPVLLMTGEHDRLAPPDEIRAISHRIHDPKSRNAGAGPIRFEVIAGAGHVCNLEQPLLYNARLKAFFDMLGLRTPSTGEQKKRTQRQEKRQRILDAALAEFAQNGFAGASMQAIAQSAGVSKPTLYQYIGQKEDMFAAILDTGRQKLLTPFSGDPELPIVPTLWKFARTYADFVLAPDMLALARVVIGEAERVPDLARRYYDNGPGRAFAGIKTYIETQGRLGRLQFDDASSTAEHLWTLILSSPRTHALHFPKDVIDPVAVEKSIRQGLTAFLRAYSVETDKDLSQLANESWET